MSDSQNLGWVRIHRKIQNNFLWFLEPFTKAQAWIDLFLNANHKDSKINIRGNIIDIKRSQMGWSELTMAKRWQWSKGKVRRFLKLLETEQQIIQQKTALTTIITILNYEPYQSDSTTDSTTERQQTDSRRYTNKNDKNDKNDNSINTTVVPPVDKRNPNIDKLINLIKDKFNLNLLDGTVQENRRYAHLLLVKVKNDFTLLESVLDLAAADRFWQNKITAVKPLYYNIIKIASISKEPEPENRILDIDAMREAKRKDGKCIT